MLTGSIPPELVDSSKLQGLYLGNNQLTGTIPGRLGGLCSLVKLNLSGNQLHGPVPRSFGDLKELTHLDLSYNELDGELPSSVSQMMSLVGLYVQQNRLSGPLGAVPVELGNLMQLEYFDVSGNMLSGKIPENICALVNLFYLSLAENSLEGPVPRSGSCLNLSRISLAGNKDLCGRILGLDCRIKRFNKLYFLNAWGLAGVAVGCMIVTLSTALALRKWIMRESGQGDAEKIEERKLNSFTDQNLYFLSSSSRLKEPLSINIAMFEQPLLKTTLRVHFGYIPPEYGQSGRSTTRGDVYSFGVILLELIKKGQTADVLDPTVLSADSKPMMLQVLQIAAVCMSDNPANRPTMLKVLKFLKGIRDELV
ncbi:hypothetical protein OIU77_000065 [Salix suchowensis]|uniref:Serine-threonine/tyrosine-protein kinase catalytic domain-containing protein n=1 Tax=Salix suchowensis TaxID=1278906 RepID=A0ABQ9B4U3_9ROSI|nr:hypothetical protein OIU77_000065 [Salix suchowensis]